jgi:DNA polymerase III delta prime subunit
MPLRYMFYGPEGVGKTTLAASAPDPILLDIEDGSSRVDVARYVFRDTANGHVPASYSDVIAAIDDLIASPHDYKTLAIDSVDRLESLLWKQMMERDSQVSARNPKGITYESIEDYGYGKGYINAVEEWRALCARLDRLRTVRQMSIVLVGHAQIRLFKNPQGEDFDRYQLRIDNKAGGFLKEWADVTGFACFEEDAAKAPGMKSQRPKGFSTGKRLLKLSRTAAVDAKSRINLPDEVEISLDNPWGPFGAAVEASYEEEIPKLAAAINAEITRINDPEMAARAAAPIAAAVEAKDASALSRYLTDLQKRPAKVAEAQ